MPSSSQAINASLGTFPLHKSCALIFCHLQHATSLIWERRRGARVVDAREQGDCFAQHTPWREQSGREREERRCAEEHAADRTRWRAAEERLSARVRALESDKHSARASAGGRKTGAVVVGGVGLEADYVRIKDKLSDLQTRLSKEGLRAAKAELALTKARKEYRAAVDALQDTATTLRQSNADKVPPPPLSASLLPLPPSARA